MVTKEISTGDRIQPCFVEPMQVSAVRQTAGQWRVDIRCKARRLSLSRGQAHKWRCPLVAAGKRLYPVLQHSNHWWFLPAAALWFLLGKLDALTGLLFTYLISLQFTLRFSGTEIWSLEKRKIKARNYG